MKDGHGGISGHREFDAVVRKDILSILSHSESSVQQFLGNL